MGSETTVSAATEVIFSDAFTAGLSADAATDPWRTRPVDGFPAGDGRVSTGPDGLVVVPTGTNPATGEPAFAAAPGPLGDADHLRWMILANRVASTGAPGFDVDPTGTLAVTARLSVRGYGLAGHPYGDAVPDPRRDLRVGAGVLVCIDMSTGIVFDFIVTDGCVLATYERLALPGTDHAAFSYAVPVLDRAPEDTHTLTVSYDAGTGSAHWYIGSTEVLTVDRPGLRTVDARYLKRDNGRPESAAVPRQLTCGLGLFTDRLWGQGVRLAARSVEVRRSPIATRSTRKDTQ